MSSIGTELRRGSAVLIEQARGLSLAASWLATIVES
jgi:hypothetical protein